MKSKVKRIPAPLKICTEQMSEKGMQAVTDSANNLKPTSQSGRTFGDFKKSWMKYIKDLKD